MLSRWRRSGGSSVAEAEARAERAEAEVVELRLALEQRDAVIEELRARISKLEGQLSANSSNSSKPPSSDPVGRKPKRGSGRKGKKLKRGGQPGHDGTTRRPPTRAEADEERDCVPQHCEHCGEALSGSDPKPVGRVIIDIPKPSVRIIWYWLHRLHCAKCGRTTQGQPPNAMGQSHFGVSLHALSVLLCGRFRQTKRLVSEMLYTLYGLEISPATVCAMEQRASEALAGPVDELRADLRAREVVHADETSWRRLRDKAWLWVAATETTVSYWIDRRRSSKVVERMLGADFGGTIVVDRWSAYARLRRAFCWAHLLRDFEAMIDRYSSPWHGQRLAHCTRQILSLWRRWADGDISRADMTEQMKPLQATFEARLDWATRNAPGEDARKKAREIARHKECLWRFVEDPRVPPTNNLAERVIRPGVILRKLTFGNDSLRGSVFTERILTTVETLRLQQRDVFDFLGQALTAHNHKQPAPSLLPSRSDT